jgi:uncharacterized membrane protein YraQ (UPF0718 family)
MTESILRALSMAFAMGCEILWPLILGFTLSAVVQAVVSHREMARLLPNDGPRSTATALGLGAASSSCSYAAVALATLFRKGADFTAAMPFEVASTNPVAELSINHAGVPWLATHAGRIRRRTDHGRTFLVCDTPLSCQQDVWSGVLLRSEEHFKFIRWKRLGI